MDKKSNFLLTLFTVFILGNICLVCSYISGYFIFGETEYTEAILALTNIHILLSQFLISGLVSIIAFLFEKLILDLMYNPNAENIPLKNLIKVYISNISKIIIYFIIFTTIMRMVINYSIIPNNLLALYFSFIALIAIFKTITYITIHSTNKFNKKLQTRIENQLNKK